MPLFAIPFASLDDTAHIIQTALTPIFLLAGVANLLAVFSNRLARIADRVDLISAELAKADDDARQDLLLQFYFLRRRSHVLDAAVVLGAVAGVATCGAALILFLSALHNKEGTIEMLGLFGLAILATIGALVAFLTEVLMASVNLRGAIWALSRDAPPNRD
ncbi:MAG TPA: DUF2721 domain-containing protein [Methylovirgula sp.]|jgi:hypothetical protein